MFGYVLLVILVTAGVTLAESFLIAFVAGLLGIGVSFKVMPLFFRGRVREALWRKLRDQYLNMEAEIEIER